MNESQTEEIMEKCVNTIEELTERVSKLENEMEKFKEILSEKNLKNLEVKHCKSEKIPMIRLADITANYLYGGILNDKPIQKTIYIKMLP